jgi:hypothetical protein
MKSASPATTPVMVHLLGTISVLMRLAAPITTMTLHGAPSACRTLPVAEPVRTGIAVSHVVALFPDSAVERFASVAVVVAARLNNWVTGAQNAEVHVIRGLGPEICWSRNRSGATLRRCQLGQTRTGVGFAFRQPGFGDRTQSECQCELRTKVEHCAALQQADTATESADTVKHWKDSGPDLQKMSYIQGRDPDEKCRPNVGSNPARRPAATSGHRVQVQIDSIRCVGPGRR